MQKSFTIIELLVVIAIIGLLASVVLVSTGGIKSKANITKNLEFSQSVQRALGAFAVGLWGFDEGSGTTAADGSGYANNGVINGPVSYVSNTPHSEAGVGSGKYALSFNGTNNYVKISSAKSLPQSVMTIESWINIASLTNWRTIINHDKDSNGGWNMNVDDGGNASLTIKSGAGFYTGYKSGITTNKWYHIVSVYDGAKVKLYINAQKGTDAALSSAVLDSAGDIYIGSDDYTANLFSGAIDEVRIYDYALSISQIRKHYAESLERHKSLAIK